MHWIPKYPLIREFIGEADSGIFTVWRLSLNLELKGELDDNTKQFEIYLKICTVQCDSENAYIIFVIRPKREDI